MLGTVVGGADLQEIHLHCGVQAHFLLPGNGRPLRGVHVRPATSDVAVDAYHEAVRAQGFASMSLGFRSEQHEWYTTKGTVMARSLLAALERFAAHTGRPEVAHLPLVLSGYSRGGVWARDIAMLIPERVIAYANVSGWIASPRTDAQRQVPALFVLGSETTPKEPWRMLSSVPVDFDRGRRAGNPWALAIQWGVNEHGTQNESGIMLPFFEGAIRQRLPAHADPTKGPVRLQPAALEAGWLGDRTGWRVVTAPGKGGKTDVIRVERQSPDEEVAPASRFSGDRDAAVWLPDVRTALVWRAFHTGDQGVVLDAVVRASGQRLPPHRHRRMVVDVNQALELSLSLSRPGSSLRSVQYQDGDVRIEAPISTPPWTLSWTPGTHGIHPVLALWEASDGTSGIAGPALVIARAP